VPLAGQREEKVDSRNNKKRSRMTLLGRRKGASKKREMLTRKEGKGYSKKRKKGSKKIAPSTRGTVEREKNGDD